MKNWSVPKRVLSLILYDGRGDRFQQTRVLSNIDESYKIELSTNASVSGAAQEAAINIYGLKRETMNYLSTSYAAFVSNQIKNRIEIVGGYEGQDGLLFSGDIIQAVPHLENANYYVEIKAMSHFSRMINDIVSYSFKGINTIQTIVRKIANDFGFVLVDDLMASYVVQDYSGSDMNCNQHLRRLSDITGLDIYIQYDRLFLKEKGNGLQKYPRFEINPSNMIGYPRPTQTGCEVDVLLNSSLLTGQKVRMRTERFPQLNTDEFSIQTISHKLDTKGNTWMTTLNLVRRFIRG